MAMTWMLDETYPWSHIIEMNHRIYREMFVFVFFQHFSKFVAAVFFISFAQIEWSIAMWYRKSTQVWEFSKELGEHMIKFHPKISGIFLPFPSFLLKSRVFGNNDQDHLYGFILLEVMKKTFWTSSDLDFLTFSKLDQVIAWPSTVFFFKCHFLKKRPQKSTLKDLAKFTCKKGASMGFKSPLNKNPHQPFRGVFWDRQTKHPNCQFETAVFEVGPVKVEVWLGLVVGLVTQGLSDVVPKSLKKGEEKST